MFQEAKLKRKENEKNSENTGLLAVIRLGRHFWHIQHFNSAFFSYAEQSRYISYHK